MQEAFFKIQLLLQMPTLKRTILLIYLFLTLVVLTCVGYLSNQEYKTLDLKRYKEVVTSPPCMKMFSIIEQSSDKFEIPKYILYNIAYLETNYKGPFDWRYNPFLTSSAGAVGPMQIIPRYASSFAGRYVTPAELKTNIELNIYVSCKILKSLYAKYKNWELALGFYNTGYPVVNQYATFVTSNTNYKNRWINFN